MLTRMVIREVEHGEQERTHRCSLGKPLQSTSGGGNVGKRCADGAFSLESYFVNERTSVNRSSSKVVVHTANSRKKRWVEKGKHLAG